MTALEFQRAADFIRNSLATGRDASPLCGTHLVEALGRRSRRRMRARLVTASLVSGLLLLSIIIWPRLHKAQDLTYRVEGSTELGMVGSYLSAPPSKPINLHFSEGSSVVFEPKARGRVAQVTSRGATMVLEAGRARADIVHRSKTDWRIIAGPYVVSVTGTSFEVSYDDSTQTFELAMRSGVANVSGPGLVNPAEVRNTQRFVLSASNPEPKGKAAFSTLPNAEPASTSAALPNSAMQLSGGAAASVVSDLDNGLHSRKSSPIQGAPQAGSWNQLDRDGPTSANRRARRAARRRKCCGDCFRAGSFCPGQCRALCW